ncbi:MAG: TatD family hydrolase [gamma proteobacterium symbiont of Bathyaustriella thionipta]|nr:TatD family hydrolase [gamma proteobacterium symbiont of Bathyaustriella thionipta]MCU7951414.1 TatD family hydrolase [gamma proteobacterium symbiont of Bathyaustriella thionipta]MCU7952560.1 TatD family hydrolase [gamma proteobacterium symbiont of Bathyaustriella thionipta]MCU7957966.1 TatD family hydrolase [gamma proteobacterium symbiont of Bathyaustriella thionipta]MCU7966315.1 TatD family hydrolase [gamma proteobacterium symbiont of Bathyaustriella thionipta]
MTIDIGVNLTHSQFKNDIEQVIKSALAVQVDTLIVTGTSIEHSQKAQQLTEQFPDCLYATAGIHPHEASSLTNKSVTQLQALLQDKKVMAVGECGLDFNRNFSTPADQLSCFEVQLELAVELQMPVFLHQRDANDDFIKLIRKYRSGLVDAVAHCFTGGQKELESYLEEDLYVGITGWLCDERRGKELNACVHLIPGNRLMVETDAPYLFPRDLKLANENTLSSKAKKKIRSRNEPQYLPHIIETLAKIMKVDALELAQLTTYNAQRFFRL